jgi:predicted nucleic acid-binding protein
MMRLQWQVFYLYPMKLYLDSCSLQRPLDDQRQIRIATETEAIMGILSMWEKGQITLIGSDALLYEASKFTNAERATYMQELLAKIEVTIELNETINNKAVFFEANGVKALDALHLAFAEEADVDYFCTCDDKLLKKAKNLPDLTVTVVSPLELVTKFE